ncbi:MAG: hypothetical protein ABH886_01890 [Candidatus Desantisbacteria bacterium]
MKKILGIIGVLGIFGFGWNGFAMANEVTVSGTTTVFASIQSGIDACSVSGTVSVGAGTYTEAVWINKGISLVGVGSPTIDPPIDGNVVTF